MRLGNEVGFGRCIALCLGVLLVSSLTTPAGAEELIVQNDTLGEQIPVGDFVAGEHAGVRLTSPCDGAIVAVQIVWGAVVPGHPVSLEQAIHIYEGNAFPTPGTELATLEGPVLEPGYINEFRYLDETQTFPLNVPVLNGQMFYVTLEFANPTDVGPPNYGPSVVRDTDGCQAGKNVIKISSGFWMNSCSLGVVGDFAIRAIIECPGATGACCHATGICQPDM